MNTELLYFGLMNFLLLFIVGYFHLKLVERIETLEFELQCMRSNIRSIKKGKHEKNNA